MIQALVVKLLGCPAVLGYHNDRTVLFALAHHVGGPSRITFHPLGTTADSCTRRITAQSDELGSASIAALAQISLFIEQYRCDRSPMWGLLCSLDEVCV